MDTVKCDLFADDTTIHSSGKEVSQVSSDLQRSLNKVSIWCKNNSMVLHPAKTKSMVITTRQKLQRKPLLLELSLENASIEQVNKHRLLGIIIDNNLDWQPHTDSLCKTIARNLFLLSKLKFYTDSQTRLLFYNAKVRSHIDYSSTVWDGCSDNSLRRLDSLHRRAAKIVHSDSTLTTDEKLKKLNLLSLQQHLKYNKAIVMYKAWRQMVPNYISELFICSQSSFGKKEKTVRSP